MAANPEIFFEHDRLGRPLAWSVGLHIGVTIFAIVYSFVAGRSTGSGWGAGGGGDAIGATLVSSVLLQTAPAQNENILANESKGITKSQPKTIDQDPDAIAIQGKNTKIKPKPTPAANKGKPQPEPEEETNQVAFGEGGPVSGPYGAFNAGGAKGGFGFTGGGGDFGTRFAWYVQAVQRKVAENWLKYEIDPTIKSAQRVYITFDIMRDGHPANPQIEQSSGVPALDISAVRAIQRIDTFETLPPEYSGSKVSVEFWFDFKR